MALYHIGVAVALEAMATKIGCTRHLAAGVCRGCRKDGVLPWLNGKCRERGSYYHAAFLWVEFENLEPWIDWLMENM